jgi:hypothetical protein
MPVDEYQHVCCIVHYLSLLTAADSTAAAMNSSYWQGLNRCCRCCCPLVSAAADGATCSAELSQLQTLVQEMQGIVQYGSINTVAEGFESSQLQQYGADVAALDTEGCKLQLVLLPHGKGKAAKGDYARWSGSLDNAKALQDWILEQVSCV